MREVEPDLVAIRAKGDRESNSESAEVRFQRREIEETKAILVAMQSELPQSSDRVRERRVSSRSRAWAGLDDVVESKHEVPRQPTPTRKHLSGARSSRRELSFDLP